MKKIFLKNTIFLLLILALFSFASLSYNAFTKEEVKNNLNLKTAEATAGYDIEGWAWSDNIDWVSFNCSNMGNCGTSNYSVVIDASKELSGYAWSDNIGWISFNRSELSGCPSGACKAWLDSSDNLKGWAKALAGENEDDGWDGWISLNCLSNGSCGTSNYKVDLIRSNSSFDGYAWGSDVVGWLKFEDVELASASSLTANISANKTDVQVGESVHINWNSSGAEECVGSCSGEQGCNFSPGGATSGVHDTVALSEDTSYSVRCFNIFGEKTDSVSVVVSTPNLQISTSPPNIRKGDIANLSWHAEDVKNCSVTGPEGEMGTSLKGSTTVGPIENASTFTISCDTESGINFRETAIIIPLPQWQEF